MRARESGSRRLQAINNQRKGHVNGPLVIQWREREREREPPLSLPVPLPLPLPSPLPLPLDEPMGPVGAR